MKSSPSHGRTYTPLDVESNIFVTVNDFSFRLKAKGRYVVFSGNITRALFSMRKEGSLVSTFLNTVDSAERILSHVDINICLYNERFAVMGPETKPVVNWVKSAIIRFLITTKINSSHN